MEQGLVQLTRAVLHSIMLTTIRLGSHQIRRCGENAAFPTHSQWEPPWHYCGGRNCGDNPSSWVEVSPTRLFGQRHPVRAILWLPIACPNNLVPTQRNETQHLDVTQRVLLRWWGLTQACWVSMQCRTWCKWTMKFNKGYENAGRGPDVPEQRHVINFKEFEARGCICPAPKVPCGGMLWCKSLVARTNHVRPNHSM